MELDRRLAQPQQTTYFLVGCARLKGRQHPQLFVRHAQIAQSFRHPIALLDRPKNLAHHAPCLHVTAHKATCRKLAAQTGQGFAVFHKGGHMAFANGQKERVLNKSAARLAACLCGLHKCCIQGRPWASHMCQSGVLTSQGRPDPAEQDGSDGSAQIVGVQPRDGLFGPAKTVIQPVDLNLQQGQHV